MDQNNNSQNGLNNGNYEQPQQINSNQQSFEAINAQINQNNQQPIMQEPSPQPINTFEYNNTINDEPKKKKIIGIITGVLIGITLLAALIIFLVFNKNSKNENNIINDNNKSQSITSQDIEKYGLENDTIWINSALGITYNIPKQISKSSTNGSPSFSYLHGSSFQYHNGYKIYVDKSLEGNTNLETLASDIISEKFSDKYKFVYNFGSKFLKEFKNKTTNKVKIGNFNTVYFESEEFDTNSIAGNNLKVKLIGYSFKYKEEYISVYGELLVEENSKIDTLKQMLQYVINSIKDYNGESLKELGGNVKNYYDDGYASSLCSFDKEDGCTSEICLEECNNDYFTINFLSNHSLNGVIKNFGRNYNVVIKIDPSKVNWDGSLDGIFKATQSQKFEYNEYAKKDYPTYMNSFPWISYNSSTWTNEITIDILKEENIKVDQTNMKKYLIKTSQGTLGGYYIVVYTFIIDNIPYTFSYRLDSSVYEELNYIPNMTQEQSNVVIGQTEIVADSFIKTFRLLKMDSYDSYVDYN